MLTLQLNPDHGSSMSHFFVGMHCKSLNHLNKKLLGAPGLTTRSKDAAMGSWHRYKEQEATRNKKLLGAPLSPPCEVFIDLGTMQTIQEMSSRRGCRGVAFGSAFSFTKSIWPFVEVITTPCRPWPSGTLGQTTTPRGAPNDRGKFSETDCPFFGPMRPNWCSSLNWHGTP